MAGKCKHNDPHPLHRATSNQRPSQHILDFPPFISPLFLSDEYTHRCGATSNLFKPITVGTFTPSHRVALAPLTRCRINTVHIYGDHSVEYYAQCASTPGTLLITEATIVHPKAGGYAHAPGIYPEEQVDAWKKIVDAVHAKGSFIVLKLWALGWAASPNLLAAEGNPIEEIQEYVGFFATAAKNAVEGVG
ncbi:FMN-linked oxidoreductase [Dentipellis sp. KUC8613]|nr:FMN-linked oxidoreductase [Dentipellis sp. KUC8613]